VTSPHRHCEERRDEAIHRFFVRRDGLLRSARNDGIDITPHSRGATRPSFARAFAQKKRGRRESRVPDAPAASRAKVIKHTSIVTTGSPKHSGLPCAMAYSLYVLPGAPGLLATVACAGMILRNLTPASGRQDHTTSPSASAPLVNGTSASIASRPTFVTTRTPLLSRRDGWQQTTDLGWRSRLFL
jgi:hypothetical protein